MLCLSLKNILTRSAFAMFAVWSGMIMENASAVVLSDYNLFARDTLMVRDRPHISGGYIGANGYSEIGLDGVLTGNH
jgi:hypothetical protein